MSDVLRGDLASVDRMEHRARFSGLDGTTVQVEVFRAVFTLLKPHPLSLKCGVRDGHHRQPSPPTGNVAPIQTLCLFVRKSHTPARPGYRGRGLNADGLLRTGEVLALTSRPTKVAPHLG